MKILVVDDNPIHRASAHQTLGNHDLTVVENIDEAYQLLYEYMFSRIEESRFEGVLSDLLMPATGLGAVREDNPYVGTEMPTGWALAISAAVHFEASYVAVATDLNHHEHPASALLDNLCGPFKINDAEALFINDVKTVGIPGTEDSCPACNGKEAFCETCSGKKPYYRQRGKDWGFVLEQLVSREYED